MPFSASPTRRSMLGLVLAAIACSGSGAASAQTGAYPSRPVRIIVPFTPGGTTDIFARLVGEKLSQSLGQQFVIENRGGAGGNLGAEAVAKAEPDGYTLVMGTVGTHAINPSLYARMPYDALADFAPVAYVAGVPNLMVVSPRKVNATTVQEFIAEAKAAPGKFTMASSGNGTSIHLSGELFKQMTGVEMRHVPYRGSGPAVNDLIGGQVDVMFDNLPSSIEQVRAGNLRALAVTSARRFPTLPEVPTMAEAGVPDFVVTSWQGFAFPAGTPRPVVDRLNAALKRLAEDEAVQRRFLDVGATIAWSTPEELAERGRRERPMWQEAVRISGARLE